ncbi:polyadenylate-binding protein (macronuclear) [Tetrahymena thermophila SB210]|uniref:Polyadenylate-binding protein n=1 Tax=Tetrahymena thermophila (strain SB210) TaxID=312017 RepID=I7MID5_TETTS|nr:polyadenylate-binding protein [Tetrahymena thermophila SB210]EAR92920.1 polyadenylate-binding protein [Tetrahymena thermophila SB210]|eukprot:XP_001013165.1 polyadenylate-binding protein [Tetrahymena thermophila SB210]
MQQTTTTQDKRTLLNKEIKYVNQQNEDELKQKKKYILFIHNVPQDLETSALHNFMSNYGEIINLKLKKTEQNKNLGYGIVEFKTEEAYNKIFKEQELNGKISIPNSNISINVQKFNDSNRKKANRLLVLNLFEQEIPADQKEQKAQQINIIFEQIKKDLQVPHFKFYTEYNHKQKNFWVVFDFQYDDDKQEEHIYKTIKEKVEKNFSYSGAQNKGPSIIFKSNEKK